MKKLLLLLLLFSFSINGFSQSDDKFSDHLYVGGSLGGALNNFIAYLDISPVIGFKFNEVLSAGPGFTYQYLEDKYYNYTTNIIGPRAFVRVNPLPFLFAYAEYEHLFLKYKDNQTQIPYKVNVAGFLTGAGLFTNFRYDSGGYIMLLYNILETTYTPYNNPVIRFGFIYNFGE